MKNFTILIPFCILLIACNMGSASLQKQELNEEDIISSFKGTKNIIGGNSDDKFELVFESLEGNNVHGYLKTSNKRVGVTGTVERMGNTYSFKLKEYSESEHLDAEYQFDLTINGRKYNGNGSWKSFSSKTAAKLTFGN